MLLLLLQKELQEKIHNDLSPPFSHPPIPHPKVKRITQGKKGGAAMMSVRHLL
jgi:hypothetical protein